MNKALSITQYIIDNDIDVLYIADTWFKNKGDEIHLGNLQSEGYTFNHTPRNDKNRGGGIAVVYKKLIKIKKEIKPIVSTMEIMETKITINSTVITCVTIY